MARRDKKGEREIARERITRLIELAERAVRAGHQPRADRYAELAWRVKMTYQLRRTGLEGRVCRSCRAWFSGATRRVRLQGGHRATTCLRCGAVRRMPLTKGRRTKDEGRGGGSGRAEGATGARAS